MRVTRPGGHGQEGWRARRAPVNKTGIPQALAEQIVLINTRTGARATWKGGPDRAGLLFNIENLSWTADSGTLVATIDIGTGKTQRVLYRLPANDTSTGLITSWAPR